MEDLHSNYVAYAIFRLHCFIVVSLGPVDYNRLLKIVVPEGLRELLILQVEAIGLLCMVHHR